MTNFSKANLKTFFEQGDIPTGTNYADLIDSNVNLVETSLQSMAGPLSCTELITPRVSGTNAVFGGNTFQVIAGTNINLGAGNSIVVSAANSVTVSAVSMNLNASTGITAVGVDLANGSILSLATNTDLTSKTGNVTVSAGNNATLSCQNILALTAGSNVNLTPGPFGKTTLNGITSAAQILNPVAIVSAAGTAQATAAILSAAVNRGKGVVDGTTTGFTPLANKAGLVQYLFNEGASANLWPPTGGTINGLAANAAFSLAASAMVTIIHLTASAYAVK